MTFVEFFDGNHIENVYAYFSIVPRRVIIFGNSTKKINRAIKHYNDVFDERGPIKFEAKCLPATLSLAVDAISAIIEEDEEYIFDITGGSDIALAALGIVYERFTKLGKKISLHQYNFNSGKLQDCDGDNKVAFDVENAPCITVEDNIRIFGGDVIYKDSDGDVYTYLWDMNESFCKDIDKMWRICIRKPSFWNMQMETFGQVVKCGSCEGYKYTAEKTAVECALAEDNQKYKKFSKIINDLLDARLLTCFKDDGQTVTIGFKNDQVLKCLTKAGQVLEMKVYKELKYRVGEDGEPLFYDVVNGVQIEWDGELDENGESGEYDTKNEIDVLAMYKANPIFVSCKNGKFDSNELYKLKSVAARFGGTYGKMLLVATSIPKNQYRTIKQRAEDMGIAIAEIAYSEEDQTQEESLKREITTALNRFNIK